MSGDYQVKQSGWTKLAGLAMLAASLAVMLLAGAAASQDDDDPVNEARKERIDLYGGGTMEIIARKLHVKEIMGKPVETRAPSSKPLEAALKALAITNNSKSNLAAVSDKPPRSPSNTALRWFPNVSENEPTVVANPRNRNKVVAGTHFIGDTGNRCIAHYSRNGGKTWNPIPIFMPQLAHGTECSDPVLAYAPDGSRVYYAYLDLDFDFQKTFKVLVSYSDDDGETWHGPIVALSAPAADYDKPWIGTHVPVGGGGNPHDSHQSNRKWVYVSATRFDFANTSADCHIDFTRSSDMSTTWIAPQTLDSGNCSDSSPGRVRVVQGSRPQGGLGNGVIAAWYNSSTDGLRTGSFEIRTRYSADNGATFAPTVVAATDTSELQLFLGPALGYHRWWGAMFPDVEIAQNGTAHIAYTHDPMSGSGEEDGDIRYIGSAGPPYAAWSAPTTVNDDASGKPRAQGYVALEADSKGNQTTLYAIWEDHRNSETDNMDYDVFWAKRTFSHTVGPWAPNERLTDASSPSDFFFIGDYNDITVARGGNDNHYGDPFVYGVWTDRRFELDKSDFNDDVWGARMPPETPDDDYEDDEDRGRRRR